MGSTLSTLRPLPVVEVAPIKPTTEKPVDKPSVSPPPFRAPEEDDAGEWELPGRNKKPKKEKKKQKENRNYPEFVVSPQRLKRYVSLSDLQTLVLWLSADAPAPQWLLVRHKPEIRRVVVLNVPGFTLDMFNGSLDLETASATANGEEDVDTPKKTYPNTISRGDTPDDYFPITLDRRKLTPCVQDMADMFPHAWPIKAAGDDRQNKMHSPIHSFLTAPLPKNMDIAKITSSTLKRVKVTRLLMTLNELVENDYPLHSSQLELVRKTIGQEETNEDRDLLTKRKSEGWVETDISKGNNRDKNQGGSITEGKTIYSLDCEMCQTEDGLELTRISLIDWDGKVVYDTLVKPTKPITDYLTQFSGITKEKLEEISTTLADVQTHLLKLFNNDTILVGQSLDSDLLAMKFSHPHIIDTSCIYHHTRGPPYKASLRWLTQRFLRREIQNAGSVNGHDSIEDARACLDLLKLKLEKGENFGTSDDNRESIFKRLSRPPHGPKRSAIVDYGDPHKFHGAFSTTAITCTEDSQVTAAVSRCATGDPSGTVDGLPAMDFTWARFRGLEIARSFCTGSSGGSVDVNGPLPEVVKDPPKEVLIASLAETVKGIKEIYDALPKCTAFVVYSGTGDPRKWRCMNDLQRRFKEEYKVRKWDELSVQWTDAEEQKLRDSLRTARSGVGFMVVK
ncbi:hypothetical protein BDD12DRAFT_810460 [Trichophaea hybrida]|nr:hypothetical protein BDD12DRAFT_810460 [Trichophaea hybrida]